MWKFIGKIKKEQWLMLILSGAALMILAAPPSKETDQTGSFYESSQTGQTEDNAGVDTETGMLKESRETGGNGTAYLDPNGLYEAQMEERIRKILKTVEGVGQVEVMVVLKTSEEKVLRVDQNQSSSVTKD